VPAESLRAAGGGFRASTRCADLAKVDAVVVAVPTPLTRNREPELGRLVAAGTSLAGVLQAGQLGVLESTTYHDDYVPEIRELGPRTEWPDDADCTAIVTAHPDLDVERIVRESPLVVDFRGVTRGIEAPNLVRL
jgi:UDP-N-acetyl-D-mannosaminuronate dehydrogenase